MKLRRPCENCPWRVDAPREYWDPQHFIDIATTCRDDGLHQMLCHKSAGRPDGSPPIICQDWVRVEGFNAPGVRIAAMHGHITVDEVNDRGGPEVFESFDLMLRANRISIPTRNRATNPMRPPRRRRARTH